MIWGIVVNYSVADKKMRGLLLASTFLLSFQVIGQPINDSLDYVALRLLTKSDSWLYKYRFDPLSRISDGDIAYVKKEYGIDLAERNNHEHPRQLKWENKFIGNRKLKGRNKLHFPRRKPVCYLSYAQYLDDGKTLALVSIAIWADVGFRRSSGGGDVILLELIDGAWKIKETLGGFITRGIQFDTKKM